jgi:hypothetical protein
MKYGRILRVKESDFNDFWEKHKYIIPEETHIEQ